MAERVFSLRIDDAIYDALTKAAERDDRTVSGLARKILREWADKQPAPSIRPLAKRAQS